MPESGFDSYDFDGDDRWKTYLANITIPPGRDESSVVQRYKQKFYKQYVDSNFEIKPLHNASSNPGGAESSNRPPNPPRTSNVYSSPNVARNSPANSPNWQRDTILFIFSVGVLLTSILTLLPFKSFSRRFFRLAVIFHAVSAGYTLYFQQGLPRALQLPVLKQWLVAAVQEKYIYSIFYSLIFFIGTSPIPLALFAPCIDALIFSCKHIKLYYRHLSFYRPRLETACLWVDSNSGQLLAAAASFEVSLGLLLIISLITPQRSFFQLLLYWQLLRVKYHHPSSTYLHRQAWMTIGAKVEPLFRMVPALQIPVNFVKRWIQNVG